MKIAITTTGNSLDAAMESRFGRALKFLIYDLDEETFEMVDNSANSQAAQGAGVQAAKAVVNAGAACLITGHCGPKAFQALQAAKVPVYTTAGGTVASVIDLYKRNEMTPLTAPDSSGHRSKG